MTEDEHQQADSGATAPAGPGRAGSRPTHAIPGPPTPGDTPGAAAAPRGTWRRYLRDLGLIVASFALIGGIVWAISGAIVGPSGTTNLPGGSGAVAPTPLPAGQPAPDFTLPATDGQSYRLSQFRGKLVVLQFMAPWCPHCQADAPEFNRLYTAYQARGLQFLDVSATPYDRNDAGPISMADMVWFQTTYQVPYPVLFDAQATIGTKQYSVTEYPFIYIIDRTGVVRAHPNAAPADVAATLEQVLK